MLGAEIAKKCSENAKVVNAIAAHHEQVEPVCPGPCWSRRQSALGGASRLVVKR